MAFPSVATITANGLDPALNAHHWEAVKAAQRAVLESMVPRERTPLGDVWWEPLNDPPAEPLLPGQRLWRFGLHYTHF